MISRQWKKEEVFTIPNLLSLVRLGLIPVFLWIYCKKQEYGLAAVVVVISGVTDILDGFIARRFHMVSDLGKALDPIADKLTQVAVLACLTFQHPLMFLPLALLMLKETAAAVMGLVVIRRTGQVFGADWHGKVATALLYATMTLHLVWHPISPLFSTVRPLLSRAMFRPSTPTAAIWPMLSVFPRICSDRLPRWLSARSISTAT